MSDQKSGKSAETEGAKQATPGKPGAGKTPATRPVPLKEVCRDLTAIGKLDPDALEPASFAPERPAAIRRDGDTEDLLNGLIAEMHYHMRALVLPSACETIDASRRIEFIRVAGDLAITGAKVADTVARLRVATPASEEQRGQIIEAIARVS